MPAIPKTDEIPENTAFSGIFLWRAMRDLNARPSEPGRYGYKYLPDGEYIVLTYFSMSIGVLSANDRS